jgi:hypothetical protein
MRRGAAAWTAARSPRFDSLRHLRLRPRIGLPQGRKTTAPVLFLGVLGRILDLLARLFELLSGTLDRLVNFLPRPLMSRLPMA